MKTTQKNIDGQLANGKKGKDVLSYRFTNHDENVIVRGCGRRLSRIPTPGEQGKVSTNADQ